MQGFNSNEVDVRDFSLSNSGLKMSVEAFGPDNIELKKIKISDSNEKVSIPVDHEVATGDNAVISLPHLTESSETRNIDVELSYNTGDLENITATGSITGNIGFDQSLRGYWTMKENQANSTHVYDISGNSNNGLLDNPQVGEKDTIFNGENDRVEAGYEWTSNPEFSIIFEVVSTRDYDESEYDQENIMREVSTDTGYFSFEIRNSSEGRYLYLVTRSTNDGELLSVGTTFDSFEKRDKIFGALRVNGEEVSLTTNESHRYYTDTRDDKAWNFNNILLAQPRWPGNREYLNGTMSNIQVYNRYLSELEVESIKDSELIS